MIGARTAAPSARPSGVSGSTSRSSRTLPQCRSRLRGIVEACPLGRAAMPLRRFPSVARTLPVVGEKRRALTEIPRLALLERTRHRRMDARSSLSELRAIGDLLGEGVFERVLRLWIERLFVEELGFDQAPQSFGQLRLGKLPDAL
jgi:hypothetical protein